MTILHDYNLNFNSNTKFNFDGGNLTSDAGLLLIHEFMNQIQFPTLLKNHFFIKDDFSKRIHSNIDSSLQQILQFIAGYHSADHADELTHEPLLTNLLNKPVLASQPTLSRFANRLTAETAAQFESINQDLLDTYYRIQKPDHFIFDIDSTKFQTFGEQEGHGFNGHYQVEGFHPLMVFDGITGDCLKVRLRPGNDYTSKDTVPFLKPVLTHYYHQFGDLYRVVRGDSGFASSEIYDLCEEYKTDYVIRLKANNRLAKLAAPISQLVMKEENIEVSQQVQGEFMYQADSWSKPRRVIVQVRRKAGELICEHMFLVTSMETTKLELVIGFYAKRGTMENYIKECKNGFRMDKVSHSHFITNANRMMQCMLAYNLINGFRRLTLPKDYRKMMIETLRIKLLLLLRYVIKEVARKRLFIN